MTEESLTARIVKYTIAEKGQPKDLDELKKQARILAKAVVEEIKANAVVNPGSFSNSGGPVGGTGTVS